MLAHDEIQKIHSYWTEIRLNQRRDIIKAMDDISALIMTIAEIENSYNKLEKTLFKIRAERDALKKELDRIKPSRTVADEAGQEQRELK